MRTRARRATRRVAVVIATSAVTVATLSAAPTAHGPTVMRDVAPIVESLPDGGSRVSCPPYGALVSVDGTDTLSSLTCRAV